MAENVDPSPTKRARKPNFTAAECTVLLEAAEQHLDVIKSKFSSNLTNKNKNKAWDEITEKVNALGVCKRSTLEVKEKWRGMVSVAKKEHNKFAVAKKKTGGGKQPDSPKGATVKLIEIFGEDPSFSGITGGIDSAEQYSKGNTETTCTIDASYLELSCEPAKISMAPQKDAAVFSAALSAEDTLALPVCGTQPSASTCTSERKGMVAQKHRRSSSVTMNDINEMHMTVLKKESLKLDLEMENLLLKRKEISLRIQELETRANSRYLHEH